MKEDNRKIAGFVYEFLMETGKKELECVTGPKYRWEHTLRVTHWSWRLAIDEKGDVKKCVVAALFHDVSHFVSEDYGKHGVRSAEIARDFLAKEGYPKDFIEDVAYAVQSHVGEFNPKTIEAKILQDADTLDRFGYIRILLFAKTTEPFNPENVSRRAHSSLDYLKRLEKGGSGPCGPRLENEN
jgi:HD superfamily phosphodiesterase